MPLFRRWRWMDLHCPFAASGQAPWRPINCSVEERFGGDDGGAFLRGEGQDQHPHLGRHRRRQNHLSEHPFAVHSAHERIVTIEDAAELRLAQENIVRLETRPPNIEGQGAIRQRQLLINCLRMRPDRIIMGEVREKKPLTCCRP